MKPTLPIYVLQSLQGHLTVVQNFIFSLNVPNEFALLISLRINPHILGTSEDMLSVPKYTVRFLRLCSSGSFLKLNGDLSIGNTDINGYQLFVFFSGRFCPIT